MLRRAIPKIFHFGLRAIAKRAWMLALLVIFCGVQSVYAGITVTPVTWNVIGLDSNNVSVGPDTFQVGARVCNTGGTAITNVVGTFVWDSTNIYINLTGPSTDTAASLAAGACVDFYYQATVTRTTLAYNTARSYHITVSADNTAAVSTPTPRELYIEHLISQGRNSVSSITGPTTVLVGQTYTYTLNASTATQGYDQLEDFLSLSNVIFQVLAVNTTYTAPAGATNDKFYADACGWDNNPLSGTYRSCIGPANYSGGKVGGTLVTTYTVKVLSTGTTTATALILDHSGSSYHYNSDYGTTSITISAVQPTVGLQKSVNPSGSQPPGTDLTYSIAFTNTGSAPAASLIVTDPIPANTDFKVGSATTTLGSSGLTVTAAYSNNNGLTWTYTPASGGGGTLTGYDRNVTNIRWTFTGNLSPTSPANTGSVGFTVRIR